MTHEQSLTFILAGKAVVQFTNTETGNRFIYKIVAKKEKAHPKSTKSWYVYYLQESGGLGGVMETYIGYINLTKQMVAASYVEAFKPSQALSVFQYVWQHLRSGTLKPQIKIEHNGKCGACGRALTDSESITIGIGPVCRGES